MEINPLVNHHFPYETNSPNPLGLPQFFKDTVPLQDGPPQWCECWFTSPSKKIYLRIIHNIVMIVMFTNLAFTNWGPVGPYKTIVFPYIFPWFPIFSHDFPHFPMISHIYCRFRRLSSMAISRSQPGGEIKLLHMGSMGFMGSMAGTPIALLTCFHSNP